MVGLTERFDDSFILLRRALGWRLPMYMSVNAARTSEGAPVDEGAIAAIRKRNRFDLELYHFARGLFEAAVARHGSSLRRELAAFQALNRIPDALGPRTPPCLRRLRQVPSALITRRGRTAPAEHRHDAKGLARVPPDGALEAIAECRLGLPAEHRLAVVGHRHPLRLGHSVGDGAERRLDLAPDQRHDLLHHLRFDLGIPDPSSNTWPSTPGVRAGEEAVDDVVDVDPVGHAVAVRELG